MTEHDTEDRDGEDRDSDMTPARVIAFWTEAGPKRWYVRDDAFDAEIRQHFLAAYEAAASGQLAAWEETAEGALALIIVLDQFARNMFRGSRRAFDTDPLALDAARRALQRGFDRDIEPPLRQFFYLPFMHSEAMADQERCVSLFETYGDANNLKFAIIHADIIRRFGRFPHRNPVLGRTTTKDEQDFLDSGGFSG
jgi:uncharacterized protein (DUF924 family)